MHKRHLTETTSHCPFSHNRPTALSIVSANFTKNANYAFTSQCQSTQCIVIVNECQPVGSPSVRCKGGTFYIRPKYRPSSPTVENVGLLSTGTDDGLRLRVLGTLLPQQTSGSSSSSSPGTYCIIVISLRCNDCQLQFDWWIWFTECGRFVRQFCCCIEFTVQSL